MSALTVTPTPQPIYPDGLQDSFIIRNNGPYTVYVDNDGSLDASSHAIPPTGTMAWDAHRPLFARLDPTLTGAPTSTVTIVRNSSAAFFNNAIDNELWRGALQLPTNISGVATTLTSLVECSAYETIQIRMANPAALLSGANRTVPANGYYFFEIEWYDSTQTYITTDRAWSFPPWSYTSTSYPTVINMPVLGAYFLVKVTSTGAPASAAAIRIIGTTRKVSQSMYFGNTPTTPWQLVNGQGSGTAFRDSVSWLVSGAASYDFYLPNVKPHLRIQIHATVAGAGTGAISMFNPANGTNYYDIENITLDNQTLDFYLPLFQPIQMNYLSRNGTNTNYLTFIWLDV